MSDAILWQILEKVQDDLQTSLSFVPQGTDSVPAIPTTSIVIRKCSIKSRDSERHRESLPGIIISPPLKVIRNPTEGNNNRDLVRYPILIQIAATDSHSKEENLRTYLKWEEQIAKFFHSQYLDISGDEGCVVIGHALETDVIDETLFVTDPGIFQSGIVVEFDALEPRGVSS